MIPMVCLIVRFKISYSIRSVVVDWQVAGGMLTGPQAQQSFQYILDNATVSNTGFVLPIESCL